MKLTKHDIYEIKGLLLFKREYKKYLAKQKKGDNNEYRRTR